MTTSSLLRELARSLVATLVIVAIVEVLLHAVYFARNSMVEYVVLPYNAAQDFGPMPPWMDSLRILEDDETLFWRNRRNLRRRYMDVYSPVDFEKDRTALLRQFLPRIPASLRANPVWEVSLNSQGFRGDEFPAEKAESSLRIVCLGDSWTFGANVDQQDAYPQRLRALLERDFPRTDFEVLNLGVFAYSSYQGLALMQRRVIELEPDLVAIGFGMNDSSIAGYRDKDMDAYARSTPRKKQLKKLLEELESLKLLRYLAQLARHEPWSIGEYMGKIAVAAGTQDEAWVEGPGTEVADYEELEPYTRVSPPDFRANLLAMIRLARRDGIDVVLLYNQLWQTPYRSVLKEISAAEGLAMVDSKALIDAARVAMERDLEEKLDLQPPASMAASAADEVEVVFRVHQGRYAVAKALYIAGMHPKLGDGVPNRLAMHDDGTHGDQRAGDGVWSYAATFQPGTRLFYVYTNSGEAGRWQGVDIPEIRRFTVEATAQGRRVYAPIESFGRMYMQADGWHTNAAGYELIAEALLDVLKQHEKVRMHVRGLASQDAR